MKEMLRVAGALLAVGLMVLGSGAYLYCLSIQPQKATPMVKIIRVSEVPSESYFLKYEPGMIEVLKKHKTKAFVHFTGDGCIQCQTEWSSVDKTKIVKAALDKNIVLYEAKKVAGEYEYNQGLTEDLIKLGRAGVPCYVFINDKGEAKVLDSLGLDVLLLQGEKPILEQMDKL